MKKSVVILLICCLAFPVSAEEKKDLLTRLDDEFKWLREEAVVFTEIATKTRMDADLVPGMVMVLKGKDLEAEGVRTVFEALSSVPGIMTSINSIGDEQVIVRGIGGSFFSGNMKVMLDGVAVNDALTASGFALYRIPTAQIEKIEIIRGPGSVIYGDYAYAGVIDITTRKTGNQMYGRYSSYDASYGGGTTLSYAPAEKNFNISLNLSGWDSDGADVYTGRDRLYEAVVGYDLSSFSQAPGKTNESAQDRFASFSLKYKDFSLSGQHISKSGGDYFGLIHALAPPEDRLEISHEHQAVEAKQILNISKNFRADIKAGMRNYEFEMDEILSLPPIFPLGHPSGSILFTNYEEREFYGAAELICNPIGSHAMLMGTKYSDISMQDVGGAASDPEAGGQILPFEDETMWMLGDKRRAVFSAYFQDIYDVTEHFAMIGGLRYDDYTDMGTYLTPRISAVWRLTDRHILKAQYSESVRPPTFMELYSKGGSLIKGNPNLDSERIRSYETEYIYRKPGISIRLTLFYSELNDKILYPAYADTFSGVNIEYRNADGTLNSKGAEIEAESELRKNLRAGFGLSYAETEDEDGNALAGMADLLADVHLSYTPIRDYVFVLRYHYVGERHRDRDDPRDDLKSFYTVDLSGNIFNLSVRGLTLRGGVRNLFDAEIVYPATVFKDESGNIGYYYKDDFPRPGREGWIEVSYEF